MAKRRKRREFTDEYRAEVVQLVQTSGKPVAQLARDLDLTVSVVRSWVAKSKTKPKSLAVEVDHEAEVKALRKRVKVLEMEREILKKAAAFFAKENS